jgi:ATP-dependent exoDNAse (exonuclease V) beta subunit
MDFTQEQLSAIERRDRELLLDASAGSGKTSVLVERFARAALDDGVEVSSILAITFTDKAAAELRERIRLRLRELGAVDKARATEGAFISTIHGFCARVLRANALAAGIDPRFVVLDEPEASRLADQAFDDALSELGDVELIASYGAGALRAAALGSYRQLRSRGEREPRLPPLAPEPPGAREELEQAATALAAELSPISDPPARVREALGRLERLRSLSADPWPAELDCLKLPGGNGGALSTPACRAYEEALKRSRRTCEHRWAGPLHASLDRLLRSFAARYWERKRAASGLDFEDLELIVRDLFTADEKLRERYANRFEQIMVDEFQDTNKVQLDLISLIARDNLFAVGDAQQSIYGFRHADVELFEQLGERLAAAGRRTTLQTNFRSRPEIIEVINGVFADDRFRPLRPGREEPPSHQALVELLVVDKREEWAATDGIASPWRVAEARAMARRVRELIDSGTAPQDVVVLTRATTDLRAYERALEEQQIPTYLIGGRGYWSHPQVMDLVAYLRALANPRDEEAYYQLLASPLVGVSTDALVLIAAAVRAGDGRPERLADEDARRLGDFGDWFARERALVGRLGIEELIERAIAHNGYELRMLMLPGGERRLANLRKLMRLGREYAARFGPDLRGFLGLVGARAAGGRADARESEAPVEGEALDAVRLMTIHRAKGLEFDTVVVADLGREPRRGSELLRVGADGRIGLRLARPGTGKAVPALDYSALGEQRLLDEAAEERRIFYVAMTRARERLILSGAAKLGVQTGGSSAPISWIAPALAEAGVEPRIICAEEAAALSKAGAAPAELELPEFGEPSVPPPPSSPPSLSYSALAAYDRCGYRFYLERVLGLPPRGGRVVGAGALERGILVHELLERLDFRRPRVPAGLADDVARMVEGFLQTELFERLAAARDVRREEGFAFLLKSGALVTGALDVIAREQDGATLVVDYKTDRLEGADPTELVEREYRTQRLIYALAALRAGASRVEVAHVFLERPEDSVVATFTDGEALERELEQLAGSVLAGEFPVAQEPCVALCNGCPGEAGLCSWPLEMTRRDLAAPDPEPEAQARLF